MSDEIEKDPARTWRGEFGRAYTDRNREESVADVNAEYEERFGTTKTALYERFLDDIDRDARILEVGCNVGVQLDHLAELGFENLTGVDLQRGALEVARTRRSAPEVIEADGRWLPFADDAFDLVFTVDVLIHVPPPMIDAVMDELARCSREWIYGCEYYAPEYTEVAFRGETGVLWKTDFAARYESGRDLSLIDETRLANDIGGPYTVKDQFVATFLLRQSRGCD